MIVLVLNSEVWFLREYQRFQVQLKFHLPKLGSIQIGVCLRQDWFELLKLSKLVIQRLKTRKMSWDFQSDRDFILFQVNKVGLGVKKGLQI